MSQVNTRIHKVKGTPNPCGFGEVKVEVSVEYEVGNGNQIPIQ